MSAAVLAWDELPVAVRDEARGAALEMLDVRLRAVASRLAVASAAYQSSPLADHKRRRAVLESLVRQRDRIVLARAAVDRLWVGSPIASNNHEGGSMEPPPVKAGSAHGE